MSENFANEFQTTLNGAIDDTTPSVVVVSATGAPAANFRIRIDNEYMLVTAVAGTTFTVTRGIEGSTVAAHAAAATVTHVLTAGGLAQALGEGAKYYSVEVTTSSSVTDGAAYYDLPGLSIANVAAGTYLAAVDFALSNKTGHARVDLTDGSNVTFLTGGVYHTTGAVNGDSYKEFSHSYVIIVAATSTVKVRAAASASVSNYTIYRRHLTLTKIA